jgi:hypothetical protein
LSAVPHGVVCNLVKEKSESKSQQAAYEALLAASCL